MECTLSRGFPRRKLWGRCNEASLQLWERPFRDHDGGLKRIRGEGDVAGLQAAEPLLREVLVVNVRNGMFARQGEGTMRAVLPAGVVLAGGLLCFVPVGAGQSAGVNQGGPDYLHSQAGMNPVPQHGSQSASTVDQMRLAEQHRRIVVDTAKLVELSNQLKAEVDQGRQDQLSLDMVRKVAEIEKTAHDLKGWMKN